MKFEIVWSKPICLARNRNVVDFAKISDQVPEGAGIYFFSRKFGSKVKPFYIGRSLNLRRRLNTYLKAAKIQYILRGDRKYSNLALNGNKFFHFGVITSRSESKIDKCLRIIEKYMIQKAISDNIVLLNYNLTQINAHDVVFSGDKEGRSIYSCQLAIRK